MPRLIYSLIFLFLLPFILLRLLYRALRAPAYVRRWPERFALGGDLRAGGIWVHAVSVGEAIAAAPMVRELMARYPHLPITISCMTPTGSEQIRKLFAGQVGHAYLPYDLPWLQRRFIRRLKPRLAIVMETELWPNLVAEAAQAKVPVVLANARLSERSARGYTRVSWLVRPMFAALDWVAAQTQAEAVRFADLGVAKDAMSVTGSIKFDLQPAAELLQQAAELRAQWGERPVWIAASTHAGEDELILAAHQHVLNTVPDALLLVVPRHPERFAGVARMIREAGFSLAQRSLKQQPGPAEQVMLVDSMGELMQFYACADMAFVGGSLVPNGGHNYLEPAALGLPVLSGPHRFNFAEISQLLEGAGALQSVTDAESLAQQVLQWMEQPQQAQQAGAAGQAVVKANQGALDRLLTGLSRWLD